MKISDARTCQNGDSVFPSEPPPGRPGIGSLREGEAEEQERGSQHFFMAYILCPAYLIRPNYSPNQRIGRKQRN